MKNSNTINTALTIIGFFSSAIVTTNDLGPIWIWIIPALLSILHIIQHIKWKKKQKKKK